MKLLKVETSDRFVVIHFEGLADDNGELRHVTVRAEVFLPELTRLAEKALRNESPTSQRGAVRVFVEQVQALIGQEAKS